MPYKDSNKSKVYHRQYMKLYYQTNENYREYVRKQARIKRAAIREKVFDRFGRICVKCGSTKKLELDHVYGLVRTYKQSLSEWIGALVFPKKYFQVLCHNCNIKKEDWRWKREEEK